MTPAGLALTALERALNGLISEHPSALAGLAADHGRLVAIHLKGTGISLYFLPDAQGRLSLAFDAVSEPEASLTGSPLDLFNSRDTDEGTRRLFAGHVELGGDTALAQRFSAVLAGLEFDWEEHLSRLIGDLGANRVGAAVRGFSGWGRGSRDTLIGNLGEYLTEEARLVPTAFEVEEFLAEVDRLRDDAERLAARLRLLEQRASDSGENR